LQSTPPRSALRLLQARELAVNTSALWLLQARNSVQLRRKKMNKAQLIEAVAKSTKMTKTDAELILNTTLDTIKKSVKKGDDVTLIGFGTFTKSKRKARTGRNPQTGKEIKIPSMVVPKFRAGREFKDAVR
jgi:DNA-binding protein HU-beta